jgi:hypothetical protein
MKITLSQKIYSDYCKLLENLCNLGCDGGEKDMHAFLEKNSRLLPCNTGIRNDRHHGIVKGIVFSKLPLQGSFRRVPDFIFLTKTSVKSTIVFIEIEHPGKKIFTKTDDFTSQFNQAYQQLEDWKIWFEADNNKSILKGWIHEAIDDTFLAKLPIKAEFVLIYGRRKEFENMPNRIRRLEEKNKYPINVMSYDRLICDSFTNGYITIRKNENGYSAIAVDAEYDYFFPDHRAHGHFQEIEKAFIENEYKTDFNKRKNIERLHMLKSMTYEEARNWGQKHPKVLHGLKIF